MRLRTPSWSAKISSEQREDGTVRVVPDDDDETENTKLISKDLKQTTWRGSDLVARKNDDQAENPKLIIKDLEKLWGRKQTEPRTNFQDF